MNRSNAPEFKYSHNSNLDLYVLQILVAIHDKVHGKQTAPPQNQVQKLYKLEEVKNLLVSAREILSKATTHIVKLPFDELEMNPKSLALSPNVCAFLFKQEPPKKSVKKYGVYDPSQAVTKLTFSTINISTGSKGKTFVDCVSMQEMVNPQQTLRQCCGCDRVSPENFEVNPSPQINFQWERWRVCPICHSNWRLIKPLN